MDRFFEGLGAFDPGSIGFWLALAALLASLYGLRELVTGGDLRLTGGTSEHDRNMGLVVGAIGGALSGLLWYAFNPISIVPPFIHLRLFAFLIPVIGLLFGRGAGFIAGYVATLVWAPLAGAFVPLHSPIADGIMVGLTGWIPAVLLRGKRTNSELLAYIAEDPWRWYRRCAVVCLFTGLFMAFVVAVSLSLTTPLTFWVSFWAIGVVSDTLPMMLFTGLVSHWLLRMTRPSWSWMPQY